MGQKINPIGLRLGINRTWDSRWYATKGEYGNLLQEDLKIRAMLMEDLKQAAVLATAHGKSSNDRYFGGRRFSFRTIGIPIFHRKATICVFQTHSDGLEFRTKLLWDGSRIRVDRRRAWLGSHPHVPAPCGQERRVGPPLTASVQGPLPRLNGERSRYLSSFFVA